MFSLTDSLRYWYYNRPTNMRKSFHTLSGIVTDVMKRDPYSGEVFIFINRTRTRIKLLHWEAGGLVIYSKMLEAGTFGKPSSIDADNLSGTLEWRELVLMVEGMMENPDGRRQRLDGLRKMRFQ